MKPKKLIRSKITDKLQQGEWEEITNIKELNKLYALKVREELAEIQEADHKDIKEFADLLTVSVAFAKINGFGNEELYRAFVEKLEDKGDFGNLALNNLNPSNLSNKLYFEDQK